MVASKELLTEADKQSKGDMARFASLYRPASASSSACAAETVTNDEVDESMVSVGSSVESPQEVYDEGEFEEVVGENLEAAGLGAAGLLPPEPQVPPGVAAMTAAAEKAPPLTPKAQWATKEKKKRGAGGPRKKHQQKKERHRLHQVARSKEARQCKTTTARSGGAARSQRRTTEGRCGGAARRIR
jgi:hypothetical protein